MSEIKLSDESKVIDVLKDPKKPVVLAFLGNLTTSNGMESASGKMKTVMEALAGDGALNGAEFLIKHFDADGVIEKLYDVQSGPTTLLLQTKTIVGHHTQGWMTQAIKDEFHL
ncbi:hypothetical protein [Pseudomonas sp. S1_E04]